jgi:transcriptional regulator with XRE-family HTH domain
MTHTEFRAALRAIGMTQRALAERLGLAISTVNRWALGQAPVPQYAVAYLDEARLNAKWAAEVAAMAHHEARR